MSNPYAAFNAPTKTQAPSKAPASSTTSSPLNRLRLHLSTLPPPASWQKTLAAVFLFLACVSVIYSVYPSPCNSFTLPFTLTCNTVTMLLYALVVTTPPYEFDDSVFYLLQSLNMPSSSTIRKTIKPWLFMNTLAYVIGLSTAIGSSVALARFRCVNSNLFQVIGLVCLTGINYVCLCIYSAVIVRAYVISSDTGEGTVLLRWIRCSCCSRNLKKAVALMPFVGLAVAGTTITVEDWALRCDLPLHSFLVGCSAIFLVYALLGFYIFWFGGKARRGKCVTFLIGLNTLAGAVISTCGIIWLSTTDTDCMETSPRLYQAAVVMKVTLLSATLFVGVFSCCCKVENCVFRDDTFLHDMREPHPNSPLAKIKNKKTANGKGAVDLPSERL
ncbi:hypothetical protein TrVE_jg13440 [Triparma verrucosa]|uniref:Uncharacterized protein n=1 Tax=Triparma verrucosa TaxID=1606542 RepID=A0A9W7BUK2_9STRA|nr:hypothetical protein TrVE_jg13440 [Triparma verrucosa]